MDYSKYRYEQAKREKENRKNQKTVETKEIRLSLKIDIGDFNTKLNHAKKFLEAGNKLKVSIRLRGRRWPTLTWALPPCSALPRESASWALLTSNPNWRADRS